LSSASREAGSKTLALGRWPAQPAIVERSGWRAWAYGLGPWLLLTVLLSLPAFFQPAWYNDEGIFAAVAAEMQDGGLLYTDAWDNKPPGIFLVYLAGWLTPFDMTAVRLIDLAGTLAVVTIIYIVAREHLSRTAATIAAAVCALLLGLPLLEAQIANTESFLIVCTCLGMYLVLRCSVITVRPAVLIWPGLAFGAALLFKQIAVFDLAAALLFIGLRYRPDLRYPAFLIAGFAVLPALIGLFYLVAGHFGDLWYAVVESLVGYKEGGEAVEKVDAPLVQILPLAIALPYLVWLRPWRSRAPGALFVLWLAFTAVAASASGRSYPHYLIQVVPAASLVIAMMITQRPAIPHRLVTAGFIVTVLAVYHVFFGPFGNIAWNDEPEYSRGYYRNAVDYATGDRSRGDYEAWFDANTPKRLDLIDELDGLQLDTRRVFIWGDLAWAYPLADLDNPTRYSSLFLASEVEGGYDKVEALLLERDVPYIVVIDDFTEFWEAQPGLTERYEVVHGAHDGLEGVSLGFQRQLAVVAEAVAGEVGEVAAQEADVAETPVLLDVLQLVGEQRQRIRVGGVVVSAAVEDIRREGERTLP
jgi:hypothetical protein